MKLTYRHTRICAYTGYITQGIVNNLTPLLFVSFQRDFSLTLAHISFLIALNFGVQILTDLTAARLGERLDYRPAMVFAHGMTAAGLGCMAFLPFALPSFFGLCACTVMCAVGGGLLEVVVSPVVEALPGDEKAASMSLLHSFYSWGQMGVVLVSTAFFLLAGTENWRVLPLLWALVPLGNLFLSAKVPFCRLVEEGEAMPAGKLFRVGTFWIFLAVMICAGASELAMSQWASLFAEEGLRVSKTLGDLLGPCAFAALMGLSRVFFGVMGSRIDLRKFILGSGVLCAFSYLLAVFAPHPVAALFGCAICGLSVGIMWPGTFSLATRRFPQGGEAMFALLALAGDIGCTSGPALCGVVAGFGGGLKSGLLAACVFPIALCVCVLFLRNGKSGNQETGAERK